MHIIFLSLVNFFVNVVIFEKACGSTVETPVQKFCVNTVPVVAAEYWLL